MAKKTPQADQQLGMMAELEAQGRLKEALFEAQETTKNEQEELYQQFIKQGLSEGQALRQRREFR